MAITLKGQRTVRCNNIMLKGTRTLSATTTNNNVEGTTDLDVQQPITIMLKRQRTWRCTNQ